jgi:hypothetical protein
MTKTTTIQDTVIADVQKNKSGWRIRIFWFAGVFSAVVFILMIVAAWHIIVTIAPYIMLAVSGCIILLFCWMAYEIYQNIATSHVKHNAERRILNAQANKVEAEARAATFYSYSRNEGVIQHTPTGLNILALPAPQHSSDMIIDQTSSNLDFFKAMSDPMQAYAIVGPQRIGKSILAMHLAKYLTQQKTKCLVIGTKAQKGEWSGCHQFIGNDKVSEGLSVLLTEVNDRIGKKVNTPRIAVFLDDWINSTVLEPALSEQFFLEAATRILTAGIVPYFLLQSDTKTDWGIKHGAQLKNNFVHLVLKATRREGRIDYTSLKADLIYPGDPSKFEVLLPKGLPQMNDENLIIELPKPELKPTDQEQLIISLYDEGKSYRVIASEVFGSVGGRQVSEIREILSKFGCVGVSKTG